MTKEPIMIEPTYTMEIFHPASRLRCGKIHSIDWDVKARDIGMVASRDKAKLLRYYREGRNEGFDSEDDYHGHDSSQIPSLYQQTPSWIQQIPPPYPHPMFGPLQQPHYPPGRQ
jgi:hypothetical protein